MSEPDAQAEGDFSPDTRVAELDENEEKVKLPRYTVMSSGPRTAARGRR